MIFKKIMKVMPECISIAKCWNRIKDIAYIYPNPVIAYCLPPQSQQSLNDNIPLDINHLLFFHLQSSSEVFCSNSLQFCFHFLLSSISCSFYLHSSPKQLLSGILTTFMLLISMVNSQLLPYKCLVVFDIIDHFHLNKVPFYGYQNITPPTTVTGEHPESGGGGTLFSSPFVNLTKKNSVKLQKATLRQSKHFYQECAQCKAQASDSGSLNALPSGGSRDFIHFSLQVSKLPCWVSWVSKSPSILLWLIS